MMMIRKVTKIAPKGAKCTLIIGATVGAHKGKIGVGIKDW